MLYHANVKKNIIVIGGGIGGLASAALLAKDGFAVTVIEKNRELGGRARCYREKGFSFDMGPSWYMMPDVFERYFSLFGKKTSDYYRLLQLNDHYKIFFSPDRTYTIGTRLQDTVRLFEMKERGAGKRFLEFLHKSSTFYESAMKELVYQDYESLIPLLKPHVLFKLFSLNLFKTFHQEVASYIRHPDLQKILEFTTVFLGGSPYNTPAFYTLIAHTDFRQGIWYPKGGMHAVVDALISLCREYGVTFQVNEPVTGIVIRNQKACGVQTAKGTYSADRVLCNADYPFCETTLIDPSAQSYPERYWKTRTLSPSAFIIYLGISKKLQNVSHHNLYFDSSWERHFDDVYARPSWPKHPSYYVHIPSITDPSVAKKGQETVMILVPVGAGLSDTPSIRKQFSDTIIAHFENLIRQPIRDRIVVKRIFSHLDFQSDYHAYQGCAFGIAHTLFQTALFRPRNRSKKIRNLYYAGQYANPGVGVPICLISAQITHRMIKRDYERGH